RSRRVVTRALPASSTTMRRTSEMVAEHRCRSHLSTAAIPTISERRHGRTTMSDFEIGYKKPPKATQFKPGTSGNPKGRPKRVRSPLNEILEDVLDAVVKYRENGKVRTATRREVSLK